MTTLSEPHGPGQPGQVPRAAAMAEHAYREPERAGQGRPDIRAGETWGGGPGDRSPVPHECQFRGRGQEDPICVKLNWALFEKYLMRQIR